MRKAPAFNPGLAVRLVATFGALTIVLLLGFGWLALRMAENTLKNELSAKLGSIARLAAADEKVQALPFAVRVGGGAVADAARERLAALVAGTHIGNLMVSDREERVLVDARKRYEFHDPAWLLRLDRAELKRVWRGEETASQLYEGEDGRLYLSAYVPLVAGGEVRAVVVAEASADFLFNIRRMRGRFVQAGWIVLAFAGVLGWFIALQITRPLRKLREAVERVGRGDFTATAQVLAGYEVGELARAFNRMAQSVNVRHELMLESMTNGLIGVDQDGHVASMNRAAETLLGLRRDALLGRDYRERLPTEVAQAIAEALAGDEPMHGEQVEIARPGGALVLQVSTSPLTDADGRRRGAEVSFLDVTEIQRLTAAYEAQQRFAAIGEMAAEVAHQIRNPLAAIQGFADLLRSEVGAAGGKAREFLDDLLKEVRTTEGIVSNFLQYAKPTHLELAPLEVGGAVRGLVRAMQPEFDKAGVGIVPEIAPGLPAIKADAKEVEQALANLMRNALEACPRGGHVVVRASPLNGDGPGVSVQVDDDGSGIPAEVQPRLFAPFVTTKARGTGLGLSLAKKFVEAHGGTVTLTPLPKGTRAEIRLPRDPGLS